jgi:hypothetical protein
MEFSFRAKEIRDGLVALAFALDENASGRP